MNLKIPALVLTTVVSISSFGQKKAKTYEHSLRPKLVIGIVVDQMRWDYLYRFYDRYQENGFKRMMNQGFSCDNADIDYIPTVTAIGHSTIYTGSRYSWYCR